MAIKKKLSLRQKARKRALQALYGWMLTQNNLRDIETDTLQAHIEEKLDMTYFRTLLHEIPKQITDLDNLLMPYLHKRSIDELDPIEKTILRIGIYELSCELEIPYKVVINEALALTKMFGSSDSHKFVNAVLDKAAKHIRKIELE